MKSTLFLFVFLFAMSSFGQVSEANNLDTPHTIGVGHHLSGYPILKYVAEGDMKRYTFIYKNQEYVRGDDIKFFVFLSSDAELDTFYDFLVDSFNQTEAREMKIGDVTIFTEKEHLSIKITVKHPDQASGWFLLKGKSLDKLFGRA